MLLQSDEQKADPLTKQTGVPAGKQPGAKAKSKSRSGSKQGAGMPLYVPLKARNVEKAWDIWSCHLRQSNARSGLAVRDELVSLALLIAESREAAQTPDLFNIDSGDAADTQAAAAAAAHSISSFRVTAILKHLFADSVRSVYSADSGIKKDTSEEANAADAAEEPAKAIAITDIDLRLGLTSISDYQHLFDAVHSAARDYAPTGNTPMPTATTREQLALQVGDVSVARIMHLLILALAQDGFVATIDMIQAALHTAVAMNDTAATKDILQLTYRDLGLLLDPAMPAGAASHPINVLDDPQSDSCRAAVEVVLQAIADGRNPNSVDTAAYPEHPQEEIGSEQLEDLVSFENDPISAQEQAAINSWRTKTAENLYRAYISAGIKEIPSPDNSPKPALQGSVIPSASMLISLLCINCNSGNIEQAAILYDTLVATLHQSNEHTKRGKQQKQQAAKGEFVGKGISSAHALDLASWLKVSKAVHGIKQAWMMERVLIDMASDGWVPSSTACEQFLDVIDDTSEVALTKAIDGIKEGLVTCGVSVESTSEILEPLVHALVSSHLPASGKQLAVRIDQALELATEPSTCNRLRASDETGRSIISALIADGQIARARQLAEAWSIDRPELIADKNVAELILGLGNAGRHKEALGLFADIQGSSSGDISMDVLCSVLQVYVLAGDYEEAISVGKRIRAAVKENGGNKQDRQLLPTREIYNCIIKAYCAEGMPAEALRVLEEMRACQLHATSDTYAILLHTMSNLRSLDGLKLVAALANVDYNMVATGSNRDDIQDRLVADESRPLPLNTDYYNALIEAYGRVAEPIKALQVWEVMRLRGVKPNNLTATLLVDTCCWNERVHWGEDMQPQREFVEREIPDDHIYTGMPLFHMHYLGTTLKELEQAGLEFSMANYRHILEALIRAGFLEEALDMTIGKHETRAHRDAWTAESKKLLEPSGEHFLSGLASLLKQLPHKSGEAHEPLAKFMDVSFDIPLTSETAHTISGMLAAVRAKCTTKEDPEPWEMPFVQRVSPNLIQRLELHQQRLDRVLKTQRPDLLPKQMA
ncbi:hypothetical protein GGI12_001661 [Dipsacomyces acuminosporus]|nr:hypothetical protein GGI12_001661 [Dipsacomyces acuminosporus]